MAASGNVLKYAVLLPNMNNIMVYWYTMVYSSQIFFLF